MAVRKSEVLILKCQDWSESSQVVHLLAREAGRVRCLAKGSRRGLNPFSGPLDRWVVGEAVFSIADPDRLATLMELYETERLDGLRRSLPAFYGASCATELMLALVPDLDPQPATFDLAVHALRLLGEAEAAACRAITFAFAWRLLALLGYEAPRDRCLECSRPLPPGEAMNYSPGLGGPLCGKCMPDPKIGLPPGGPILRLSPKTAEALVFLASADWAAVRRVRLSQATANHMKAALSARIAELAGKELSAARYV
jgi:DNA repair protein RecO (recombination protein O)